MYLAGVPVHDQVTAPPASLVGIMVTVTGAPVEELAVLPVTIIVPPSSIAPVATRPVGTMVNPVAREGVFACRLSPTLICMSLVARRSSATLVRTA